MEPHLQIIELINASHYTEAEKTLLIGTVARSVTSKAPAEVRTLLGMRIPAEALRRQIEGLRARRTIKVVRG
jgi:hypothetical protein